MKDITFEYKDAYSNGEWRRQKCHVESLEQCIRIYGLFQPDVECRILEVKEAD